MLILDLVSYAAGDGYPEGDANTEGDACTEGMSILDNTDHIPDKLHPGSREIVVDIVAKAAIRDEPASKKGISAVA